MKTKKIYNEDCLATMKRMQGGFIDLTVTSPPYDNLRTYNDNIDKTWGEHVWKLIIQELYRVTKNGGVVVWVVGDATINGSETGTSFKQALWAMECGFNLHDTMIYRKINYIPLTHNRYEQEFEYMFVLSKGKPKIFNPLMKKNKQVGQIKGSTFRQNKDEKGAKHKDIGIAKQSIKSNIWFYNVGMGNSTKDEIAFEHSAIFPEKLARDHIYSWSNEGDLVYDPFMGSGTTAKMAHELKRDWMGSEISKDYIELANKRLKPYLSQLKLF